MRFTETNLPGCWLIRPEPAIDARGSFTRIFCAREFSRHGLSPAVAQTSCSHSLRRGALRGLHFQAAPHMEAKLVRCLRGAIYDVMVDLRPGSPTRGRWFGCELSESNILQLYAAQGFAHGFQALTDDCLVAYQMAQFYDPADARGLRWNDPEVGVTWPLPPIDLSPRDAAWPLLRDLELAQLLPFDATETVEAQ